MKKKTVNRLRGFAIFLVLMGIICFYRSPSGYALVNSTINELYQEFGLVPPPGKRYPGDVFVHFIDVGQADATLIQTPTQNILIDAGLAEGYYGVSSAIPAYLRSQGVESLDLVIATHMHSDHIAAMKDVLLLFGADKIIFPELPYQLIPTDRGFEDLLEAIAQNGKKLTPARPGDSYELGGGAVLTLLAPVTHSNDMNENSIVCRLEYGETSFMFMGDAGIPSETNILSEARDERDSTFRADVLKLGHHGSATATGDEWLDAVSPSAAIASNGVDNPYGHPSSAVIKRLISRDIMLYRTDQHGNIVVSSDGRQLILSPQKGGVDIAIRPQ